MTPEEQMKRVAMVMAEVTHVQADIARMQCENNRLALQGRGPQYQADEFYGAAQHLRSDFVNAFLCGSIDHLPG